MPTVNPQSSIFQFLQAQETTPIQLQSQLTKFSSRCLSSPASSSPTSLSLRLPLTRLAAHSQLAVCSRMLSTRITPCWQANRNHSPKHNYCLRCQLHWRHHWHSQRLWQLLFSWPIVPFPYISQWARLCSRCQLQFDPVPRPRTFVMRWGFLWLNR